MTAGKLLLNGWMKIMLEKTLTAWPRYGGASETADTISHYVVCRLLKDKRNGSVLTCCAYFGIGAAANLLVSGDVGAMVSNEAELNHIPGSSQPGSDKDLGGHGIAFSRDSY